MGQPITWRNVTAPTQAAEASSIFEQSRRNLAGALDGFGGILKGQEDLAAKNMASLDEAAKQAYLDQLAGLKTPEAMLAAEASGALSTARAGLSVAARAATRGADEARTTSLRANLAAEQQFGIAQQDLRDAPILEQSRALRAAGKTTAADALLAANPQLRLTAADIAANHTAALARTQEGRTVIREAQADALAAVASPNAIATEKFKAQLRPQEQANAIKQGALSGTQLDIQTTDANNTIQDRLIEAATAKNSQAYQESQLAGKQRLGELATKLGFKRDSTGAPDLNDLTDDQRQKLDAFALANKIPTTRDLFLGDTRAAEAHLSGLRQDPRFTAESISRNQAKITGAFNTVSTAAPVGNDALAKAAQQAGADFDQKQKDLRNRFAPGSPDALNAYADLSKQVEAALPDDVKEDGPHLQNMLMRFATKGLEIRPGVFIVPSVTDIMGEVNGYTTNFGGNVLNRTRANDIESNLKETLKGSDVTKLLLDVEESKKALKARTIRDLLNPLAPAQGPLNPLNLPPPTKK